ncbi:MAG TPA: hypothetical protein VGX48_03040 [Pyrinomonadaceae bacterium]|jgi:hypothetical protein|nr:hypothetical protein [Pyrinomonadaceae bacterium]
MLNSRFSKAALALCAGLYLFHLSFVWRYAVNVPFYDEWESFNPDQLPSGLSLRWLLAQHNEHRMATNKLLIWILYQVNGWDVAAHQVLNFIIYGAIVAFIVYLTTKLAPETPDWVAPCFAVFLLSTADIQNHVMAYQSAFHFWLLFCLVSAWALFHASQRTAVLAAGCAASVLSIYSLASGVVSSVVLLACFALFKGARAYGSEDNARRRELLQLLLVTAAIGGVVALWLWGYRKPAQHPPLAGPFSREFWDYFLNVLSFCFGVDAFSKAAGLVCLLVVLIPVCLPFLKGRTGWSPDRWAALATAACLLAVLASVAAGRAAFGAAQAKSSRYAEFGMVLVPLSAVSWASLLPSNRRMRNALLAVFWAALFAAFFNNWRFRDYRVEHAARLKGVECVRSYYLAGGDGLCPTLYPAPLGPRLDAAKRLDAAFYRDLNPPAATFP